jgi:NADPH:quinone reductase-like Zn-dependent oxidoreductase
VKHLMHTLFCRAVFTKAKIKSGQNVLVTGIGGGVAIQAAQYAIATGAKVWVTSGSADKIEKAKKLGCEGGVSYKDEDWPNQLLKMLPQDRPYLE